MKEINGKIQYRDKEIPMVFNLNVMQVVQEEYGTVEKWAELTDGAAGEPDAKAVIFGFREMFNEGLEIAAEENGTDFTPLTLKQVGRIITEYGLIKATKELNDTVIASTQSEEKNV